MNFGEKVREGHFVITAEIDPPRGPEVHGAFSRAERIKGLVDAVNVTDSPLARLRMSSVAFAALLQKEVGIETVFHLTCRDRSILGLQAELLGAHALGLRYFLALTGDSPDENRTPPSPGVFQLNSSGLVALASSLNLGVDVWSGELESATKFIVGTAVNPGAPDLPAEVERLARKIELGAAFAQTQPVFDLRILERFVKAVEPFPIPVLIGLMPLRDSRQARYFNEKVPGIQVPEALVQRLERDTGAGLNIARELLREIGDVASGVHIFPMGAVDTVGDILRVFSKPFPKKRTRPDSAASG